MVLRRSAATTFRPSGARRTSARCRSNDARGIHLESRPELEPRHALPVDGDEVGGDLAGTCSVICWTDRPSPPGEK